MGIKKFLLTLIFGLTSIAIFAEEQIIKISIDEIRYELFSESKTAHVAGHVVGLGECEIADTDIVIPESISYNGITYAVSQINERAFAYYYMLPSVKIPNSVKIIGDGAFGSCTGLSGTLHIPSSVKSLGNSAFIGCKGLDKLVLDDGIDSIGDWCFKGCSGFQGTLEIPGTVTSIGKCAFYKCVGFSELRFGDNLKSIGDEAFYGLKFKGDLIIPDSVTYIGASAFEGCDQFDGSFHLSEKLISIGTKAFYGCSGFRGSVNIPNSVTSIGDYAFHDCYGLSGTLHIPSSVKYLGICAFVGCGGFDKLVLHEGLDSISPGCFRYCGFRGVLEIPESVTSIGTVAFADCWINELRLGKSLKSIGDGAFWSCVFTEDLIIPDSVTYIGVRAFAESCHDIKLFLGQGVKRIEEEAFKGCYFIGDLIIPNSVTYIDMNAFEDCRNIERLSLGQNVDTIRAGAFYNSSIKEIECKALIPPVAEDYTFSKDSYHKPLIVPGESIEKYKTAFIWDRFEYIRSAETESIELNNSSLTLKINDSYSLVATILPETTTDKTVAWKSGNAAVATVDANGKVTAVAVGKTTITATAASGVSATCEITVVETLAESVTLSCDDATIKVNETVQLSAIVTPSQTTDKNVQWQSSDESIATVDESGLVTGRFSGKATITATASSGVSANCTVTVLPRDTEPITIARSDEYITIMDGQTAEMWVRPSGGYPDGFTFEWSCSGKIIASGNTLKITGNNKNSEKSNDTYSVRVVCVCDGETIYDEVFTFDVETWPKAATEVTIGSNSTSKKLKIREDNVLNLSADTPTGGFEDGWSFQWYLDDTPVCTGKDFREPMAMADGTGKNIENRALSVVATNYGPNGDVWGEATSSPVEVTVYRRPQMPSQLIQKGNGTSNTIIAMSPLSDEELARQGYTFVYGYTDSGEGRIVSMTSRRYCHLSTSVFRNAILPKWCYATWTYDDGSVVSSGLVYLDGSKDNDFDASDFSGKGYGLGRSDFSDSANWVRHSADGIRINVDAISDTKIEIFNTAGLPIESVDIPAGTYVEFTIDSDKLFPGIYIVSVVSSETRVIKKIVIK